MCFYIFTISLVFSIVGIVFLCNWNRLRYASKLSLDISLWADSHGLSIDALFSQLFHKNLSKPRIEEFDTEGGRREQEEGFIRCFMGERPGDRCYPAHPSP